MTVMVGHVLCIEENRNANRTLVGKPEGNRPLGVQWRMLPKWGLKKQDGRVWSGFTWLGIGSRGVVV